MCCGKYIIMEVLGHEVGIMFDSLIEHSTMAMNGKVISAGFFSVGGGDNKNISVSVFGKSVSLNKKSREKDSILLKNVLRP